MFWPLIFGTYNCRRNLVLRLTTLLISLWSVGGLAGELPNSCMSIDNDVQEENLLPFTYHFMDEAGQVEVPLLTDADKLGNELEKKIFERIVSNSNEVILGAANTNHWLTFCLTNNTNLSTNLVLLASPPGVTELDFYPQKMGVQSYQTGGSQVMATRDIFSPTFDFNIKLQPGETQSFYLRVSSHTSAYLAASIWHKPNYLIAKDKLESLDGVYAGILIGLILYTLLLYLSVRQSSSMLYILWSASTLIFLASIEGRLLQYILPDSPWVAYMIVVFSYPVCVMLSALFTQQFIKLKAYPRLNLAANAILIGFTVVLLIAYQFGPSLYYKICAIFLIVVIIFFTLITPLYGFVVKRSELSKYFLIAQLPLILCALDRSFFIMRVSSKYYIPYEPKVGLVAVMVLLAYYIGLTIYKEKNEAQQQALKQLKISNDLKTNYNDELEAEIERNVSDIRAMNIGLEQQAEKLLELDELKSKFFANISHEFRTPLTLIQGPLSQLVNRPGHPDREILNGVIRHSKSLKTLIDQLLTLSKFDGQSLSLQTSKINVSEVTRFFTSQFSSLTESKDVKLEFTTSVPDIEAYIDYEKFQIMLNNLLSNAIKFTSGGGIILVNVSATTNESSESDEQTTDEYVQISVSDNGCGIPDDEVDYVFDRFFQSRSSEQSVTGTGIGLALVKELVLLHAGDVKVTRNQRSDQSDAIDAGSCFTIGLPLGRAHLQDLEIIEKTPSVVTSGSDDPEVGLPLAIEESDQIKLQNSGTDFDNQPSILVVDDNGDMRAYIRSLLEPMYKVIEAVDGVNAEEQVKQHKPDLIVTDLMMPKRDGLEFVKSLKKNNDFFKIPVIMLTARAGLEDRLKGLVGAVDDYMAKPFDANELIVRVRNLLLKHAQFKAFYRDDLRIKPLDEQAESSEDSYVVKLRQIVNKHLSDSSFGVNQLADLMHVSKSTLHRKLSAKSKFTPSEFIRHCRLEKARQLSLSGDVRTLSELANSVGFNQAAYFSRLYQKTFNTLPIDDSSAT